MNICQKMIRHTCKYKMCLFVECIVKEKQSAMFITQIITLKTHAYYSTLPILCILAFEPRGFAISRSSKYPKIMRASFWIAKIGWFFTYSLSKTSRKTSLFEWWGLSTLWRTSGFCKSAKHKKMWLKYFCLLFHYKCILHINIFFLLICWKWDAPLVFEIDCTFDYSVSKGYIL